MTGENVTFENLALTLEMNTNQNISKWELTALTVSYTANIEGSGSVTQKDDLLVTPKPGYTSNPADAVCTLGYRTCSPTWLYWSCDEQDIKPMVPKETDLKHMVGVIIPGMKLQPFLQNQTQG